MDELTPLGGSATRAREPDALANALGAYRRSLNARIPIFATVAAAR